MRTTLLFSSTIAAVLLFMLLVVSPPAHALYKEDAGQLDFTVATAGHGPTRFVHASSEGGSIIITSDSTSVSDESGDSSTASCYIASREISTGKLLWRRNVCSSASASATASSDGRQHAIAVAEFLNTVVTVDTAGVVRAWNVETGGLLWDAQVPSKKERQSTNNSPQIWTMTKEMEVVKTLVIVAMEAGSNDVTILDAATGKTSTSDSSTPLSWPSRREALMARPGADAASSNNNNNNGATPMEAKCESMNLVVAFLPNAGALAVQTAQEGTPGMLQSDWKLSSKDDSVTSLTLVDCQEDSMAVLISTRRGTTSQVSITKGMKDLYHATTIWSSEEGLSSIQSALLLDTSHVVEDAAAVENGHAEALLSFSSRITSHYESLLTAVGLLPQDQDAADRRDHFFGFLKVAVLLSKSSHRLYGMATGGGNDRRSKLVFQLELPATADWHKMVHGTTNAASGRHGIHGGTHSKSVLILSGQDKRLDWLCADGTTGAIQGQGSLAISSPVLQIIPVANNPTGSSACRQGAMVVLEDYSMALIPNDDNAMRQSATDVINSSSENGLYAHALFYNKETSSSTNSASLQALFIPKTTTEALPKARIMGTALFPGEEIVATAYPPRDEVIQSPCTVLGDQSLLLKYMNPHLVVVMTLQKKQSKKKKKDDASSSRDLFSAALSPDKTTTTTGTSGTGTQKRKPLGVTTTNENVTAAPATTSSASTESNDDEPNMFVNVIDSVSGRVLYRASHAHVVVDSPPPSMQVSENWIFYTFMNQRTRRAEIGVLSLYEGMIDSQGLTAFSRPEQSTQFSSWNARDSKPVVLAKTFSLNKPATALGVTQTRGGISGRRLLLATLDGHVYAMERTALEPRRPLGPLKDSEKKEPGLRQYSELLPTLSYMALSYDLNIEGVQSIISAPTDLESQTMVLAYGGPDLFFTRTSPSRGFDLLPDSFNRIMLSVGVVGLIGLLLFVRSRVKSKIQKQGWV